MRQIDNIFIHCTAGFGDVAAIRRWWRTPKPQGPGWKNDGYHFFIYTDGTIEPLMPIDRVSNGVQGFNSNSIHIAYQGGVDRKNVNKAVDTRTDEQKASILYVINEVMEVLKKHQSIEHIKIAGHRDASPDKNGNGVIDPWERIKDCPSFCAIPEYKWITGKVAMQSKKLVWRQSEYSL
ncbi:N-acetylmuramoyl-L-alanine amidase [Litoribacter populi]|uniref:N-acetylmuramoyl-L-alanine amidase n=1 Tax=Litoribacter populi TaxID=2598460 RepID=UPI00117E8370|nr:N-acetylmuramoyl-L-alanine amidase [Litoribacter populi]